LALNPKTVTVDVPFGANNKAILEKTFTVIDIASLDTVTETSF